MHFPAAERLTKAIKDKDASEQNFREANERFLEAGARFFDRLALLSGGALVLSVSLLGFLFGRTAEPITALWLIHLGWALFLITLMTASYVQLTHSNYVFFQRKAWYLGDLIRVANEKLAAGVEADAVTVASRQQLRQQEEAKSHRDAEVWWKVYRACQISSQIAFFLAVLAMVAFAVLNIR